MTIRTGKSKKTTVPQRSRGESSPTAFKAVAEKREFTHCIQGSGGRQEGSATLIKEKEQRGQGIEDEGQKGKRCPVPMVSAGKHGILQRAVVRQKVEVRVQIDRLSLVRVWIYCWDRPTVL